MYRLHQANALALARELELDQAGLNRALPLGQAQRRVERLPETGYN